jgi:6-phosphogluconolactonase
MKTLKIIIAATLVAFVFASCINNQGKKSDNVYLAIGTYTEDLGWVKGQAEGFYIYSFNTRSGMLTYVSTSPSIANPSYVRVHPNGKIIYAVSETGGSGEMDFGEIQTFSFDASNKKISHINTVSSKGKSPCYLDLDFESNRAFVANYGGGIALFPIENDIIKDATDFLYHQGKSTHWRQETSHPHKIEPLNDSLVLVTDLGTNKLYLYAIGKSNTLKLQKEIEMANGESGPRHFAVNSSSNKVYVLNELNSTIEVFDLGSLQREQLIMAVDTAQTIAGGSSEIKIHPFGKFLFASTRGEANVISLFEIDRLGNLAYVSSFPSKGKTPRHFAFSPDGKFMVVANQDSNNLVVFEIDPESGELIETDINIEVPTPTCLQFFSE